MVFLKNLFTFCFFVIVLICKKNAQEHDHVHVSSDWLEECPFFNNHELATYVDNYLTLNEEMCDDLDLCPPIPSWALSSGYDWKHISDNTETVNIIPIEKADIGLHIFASFYMENISSVIMKDMSFRVDYSLKLMWHVPKEICDHYYSNILEKNFENDFGNSTEIEINSRFFNMLWLPDIYIANSFKSIQQSAPIDTRTVILHIENKDRKANPFCYVSYLSKMADTMFCTMDFTVYPFDSQVCLITIRSFSYDFKKIKLHWNKIDWYRHLLLPGYKVKLQNNITIHEEVMNVSYSFLKAEFVITRQISSILTNSYFPTLLIILVSISTFWLDYSAIGDRLNTGIIAVLAIYDQFNSTSKMLPSIGYITPIGYWMILCMLIVFAQLFQNAIYYFLLGKGKYLKKVKKIQIEDIKLDEKLDKKSKELKNTERKPFIAFLTSVKYPKESSKYISARFDSFSRVVFCVGLIVFLAVYWPYVLKKSSMYNEEN